MVRMKGTNVPCCAFKKSLRQGMPNVGGHAIAARGGVGKRDNRLAFGAAALLGLFGS